MTKGERIRSLRESRGLSQVSLADKINVSKQTLYKYENDIITNIPSDKIEELADALGTVPEVIMGWTRRSDSISSLPTDENTLLSSYRKLNDFGKKKAREDVEDLTYVPKYVKDPDPTLLQAAHQRTDIEIPEGVDTSDDKFFD